MTPPETVVDATNHASMSEIRLDQIFVKSDPQSLHSAKTGFSDCSNTILDVMVVPFGFSIGDFIAVADKFKDICVALKDHGGAATDYQTTVKKLETIKAVLLSLNDLKSNGTSLGLLNAIRTQATSLGQDIGLFLKDIKPYEGDLGCGSAKGFRHGVGSKIKWAQYVSKKVSKLDESTAYHISILQMLLGMQTADAIYRLTQTIGNLDSLLRSNHHQDLQSVNDLTTTEAASNTGYHTIIDSQLRSNQHNTHQNQQSIKSPIISRFLNERFPSQARSSSALAQMFPYGPAVLPATTVGGAARIFRCFIDQPIMAGSNKDMMVALARSHSSLSPHQINDTLENLETIIQFAMAYVLIALKELLIRLPQVLVIARMMQVLPRAISLMRQDCIRFEDALGRIQNLQYQQFQYWPIFEAMVKTQFEGVPGYGKILRRQYTLMCPRLHGQQLVAASWSQHVFPGMTVFMAVDVKVPDFRDDRCPKCSRNNTSSHSATGLRCYSCGLVFSKGFATNIVIAATELENNGARVEQLHPNGRLISGPSAEAGDNEVTNPNDEFTDSEDATEILKVFKRVNLLRVPGDVSISDADIRVFQDMLINNATLAPLHREYEREKARNARLLEENRERTRHLDAVVADNMRREAAMDDAIFRPNRLRSRSATLIENRRAGECVGAVAVQRSVRKRRRVEKDTT